MESLKKTVGVTNPEYLGWYGRYAPSVNSRRLLHEAGFKYDSDAYNDDLPYWTTGGLLFINYMVTRIGRGRFLIT